MKKYLSLCLCLAALETSFLSVHAQTTLDGDHIVSGNLDVGVTGTARSLTVTGSTTIGGKLSVTGTQTVAGRLGVATTSPLSALHVNTSGTGNIRITAFGDSAKSAILGISNEEMLLQAPSGYGNGVMSFHVNNSERMRISSSGNLGIGTTTPAAKLDVNGSAKFRGPLIVSGTVVSGTVVASGTNLLLIPQQGDLSMGEFTGGIQP